MSKTSGKHSTIFYSFILFSIKLFQLLFIIIFTRIILPFQREFESHRKFFYSIEEEVTRASCHKTQLEVVRKMKDDTSRNYEYNLSAISPRTVTTQ